MDSIAETRGVDQGSQNEQAKAATRLWIWMAALVALVLLSALLSWFDDTTELVPTHNDIALAVFYVAGLSGFAAGGISIYLSKRIVVWRRIGIALSFVLLGLFAGFMIAYRTANIIEGVWDFLPTKTRTYPALLLISRAYSTHGKGRSWNIQTTPLWSNLDITEDDYNFMLAHRPNGKGPQNPDEISSKGYFCARVTMQSAGRALRILHAGSRTLPEGTVIICPKKWPCLS